MALYQQLQADVKQAMLARDEIARDTLRMLVAAVKKQELEQGKVITDELVMTILSASAKTRAESIAQFTAAGRMDLVAKEQAELGVVRRDRRAHRRTRHLLQEGCGHADEGGHGEAQGRDRRQAGAEARGRAARLMGGVRVQVARGVR